MQFDQLLRDHVGDLGRFQILALCIFVYEEVYFGAQMMMSVYIAAVPQHWCRHPDDDRLLAANCSLQERQALTVPLVPDAATGQSTLSKCLRYASLDAHQPVLEELCSPSSMDGTTSIPSTWQYNDTIPCQDWIYDDSQYSSTIATEWNLVCDNAWMASTVASAFLGGRAVGNFVFGWLSDRFGRKPVFISAGLGHVICGVICAISPYYVMFVVMRFLSSVFATGKTCTLLIWVMESTGPAHRTPVFIIYTLGFVIGYILLTPIAYFIRDWRTLLLTISVPELSVYVMLFLISPLVVRDRPGRASGSSREENSQNQQENAARNLYCHHKCGKTKHITPGFTSNPSNTSDITDPVLFVTPMAAIIFVYYGLSFNTGNLGGSPYINAFISAAVELPGCLTLWFMVQYIGRTKTLVATNILTGVFLLACVPVPSDMNWLIVTLSMIGKFFNAIATNAVWMVSTEVYPTCIRSVGLMVTSIAARVSSPFAPYMLLLGDISKALPLAICGVLAISAGFLSLLLPETRNKCLAQTIEDGEMFIRKNRLFCSGKQGKVVDRKDSEELPMTERSEEKC